MSGETPSFETLDLLSAEPIEVHEEAGAISRLTLWIETSAAEYTLTIETQRAHDLGVLEDSAEQPTSDDLDEDREPVLIIPDDLVNPDFARNVLKWPLSVLERFLVLQSDETKNMNPPSPEMKRYINNSIWPLATEEQ